MAPGPALVVGLGNPGPEYAETRHNVGVRVAEVLAARAGGGRFSKHKANADVLEGRLAGRRVVLAVPRTYMNVSGGPVAGLLRYYGVAPADLLVVHDDLDLGFGVVRLKQGGGEGGHNGLRSISAASAARPGGRIRRTSSSSGSRGRNVRSWSSRSTSRRTPRRRCCTTAWSRRRTGSTRCRADPPVTHRRQRGGDDLRLLDRRANRPHKR